MSAIGFYCTFGSFIVAAILHPQEFWCITCAVIYVCTIPSMYLLLMIYSLFNMNNVSWGTREAPKTEEEKAAENAQKAEAAKKKVEGGRHPGLGQAVWLLLQLPVLRLLPCCLRTLFVSTHILP